MGLFSKPKYRGYNCSVMRYQDALEFQDYVVREANTTYNLNLNEPIRQQNDGYILLSYFSNSRKNEAFIVYVTDLTVLIGVEDTFLSDDKIQKVIESGIREFADAGIKIQFSGMTKTIDAFKLFQYMKASAGLY